MKPVTLTTLREMKARAEKIACLTAYDASHAAVLDNAGVDLIMVGDSLGMVIQGHDSTLPVTLADVIYHTRCVRRGSRRAFVVSDLPFMSYASSAQALGNAARLMQEGGAQMVKLEGGAWLADTVSALTQRGLPVCAHLGLLPQSVHQLGGYRVQGRAEDDAQRLLDDARILEQAGAGMIVLEAIPATLASQVTAAAGVPTIGIGAGADCHGQVLVLHDMLDVYPGKKAKFVKNYMKAAAGSIHDAVALYVDEVRSGKFPGREHSF